MHHNGTLKNRGEDWVADYKYPIIFAFYFSESKIITKLENFDQIYFNSHQFSEMQR